ncbi:MAG: metallophosphoesterase [Phycisphaerales bacterium]|nr:metallophosphoesterase [Phycisphaerales bacterium]
MTRTIVISDTHIPRKGKLTSARLLAPLIEDCDRLVVNGDLAETHKQGLRPQVESELRTLKSMVEKAGIELVLLSGNHDPEISQWRAAEFAGGDILVTHGDAFDSRIAPWAREAEVMKTEWERIQRLHPGDETITTRFDSVRGAAIAEWWMDPTKPGYSTLLSIMLRPRALRKVLQQWKQFPTIARTFCSRFFPRAEWIVAGHCHRFGIDRRARPSVINTGAFGFPTKPYAVILDSNRIQVRPLSNGPNGWTLEGARNVLEETVQDAGELHQLHGPPSELPLGNQVIPRAWVAGLQTGPGTTSPPPEGS